MDMGAIAPELRDRLNFVIALALSVGRQAAAFRRHASSAELDIRTKGVHDFVTVADQRAEQSIRDAISTAFPGDSVVGEEGGGKSDGRATWVVDPIDGTTNYLRGFCHWGVSIAFVMETELALGIIYDASRDAVYFAANGAGAWCNGQRLRVDDVADPASAMALLGHSQRTSFETYLGLLARLDGMGMEYRRLGAAAICLLRVADGSANLYHEAHLQGWDMMAGALIAREAGAIVHMPPIAKALATGGPLLAVVPGLQDEVGFLGDALTAAE